MKKTNKTNAAKNTQNAKNCGRNSSKQENSKDCR